MTPHPVAPALGSYAHAAREAAMVAMALPDARRDQSYEVVTVLERRRDDLLGQLDRLHARVKACLTTD